MLKINNLALLSVILLLTQSAFAFQQSDATFNFLSLPTSPRIAALGGQSVSFQQGDLLSTLHNPAYTDSTFNNTVQFVYFNHFSDVGMSTFAYAHQIKSVGLLTTHLRYLNYGNMQGYDESGFETSSFNVYDVALSATLARQIAPHFSVGLGTTLIRSSIQEFQSHAITFSGGLYYLIPNESLSLGLLIQNIGFQLDSFNGTREQVPYSIALGLTKRLKYVPFRFTVTAHHLNQWPLKSIYDQKDPDFTTSFLRHLSFGGEFLFSKSFIFRFGLNKYQADALSTASRLDFSGSSFGLGINISRFQIDFSRTSFSSVGNHLLLSLATRF
jgi:hypothetical protein